tara:strand:- start:1090 stop:1446 length:357 start_codon:yes stop_codon:yes gene_type:complete
MNDLDIDELLKLVEEKNDVKGETCLICHFPDNKENLLKLGCGHFYHSKCLFSSTNKMNQSSNKNFCPYCGIKIIKSKISKTCPKINSTNIPDLKCQVILKTGLNKGKVCNRINCRYHG